MIAAELLRFKSRRLVKWLTFFASLAIAFSGFLVFINSRAESPGALSDDTVREMPIYEDCASGNFGDPPPGAGTLEEFCLDIARQNSFIEDKRFQASEMDEIIMGMTVPLAMLALFLGASFVGAEWQKGTITTTLTWENRRWVIFGAKALAVIAGTVALFVLLQAFLAVVLLPSALFRGATEGIDAAWWKDTAVTFARCAAVTAIAGVVGMSLASLGRNTAAALGIAFGYMVVLENLIRALKPQWRQWLVVDNVGAFVTDDTSPFPGMLHSATSAGLLVLAYSVVMAAIAYGFFRTRDVT